MKKQEEKIKLSIVTISYRKTSSLAKTLESVDQQSIAPHEHIVIISDINSQGINDIKNKNTKLYRKFIFNQDKGLYNAMNIALHQATGNCILFLNGGDTFFLSQSISLINTYWQHKKCLIFRTVQCFGYNGYIRPGLNNINDLLTRPGHQGFIAPLEQKTTERLYFLENKKISSDSFWMKQNINKYQAIIRKEVLTKFDLGGLSNYPTLKSVILRYKSNEFFQTIKEVAKLFLRLILGNQRYYFYLAKLKKYDLITLE